MFGEQPSDPPPPPPQVGVKSPMMTTFTHTKECDTTIWVGRDARLSRINPNIYGGFIEHIGRAVYGGIYDPGNELSDKDGFRKDVIEALKELSVPVVRYPGGNFVATYHWEDGVGPREKRPKRPELAWQGLESNEFGTDEFMKWCSVVGTEPYICLNMGTGTLDEAINWLDYCNGTRDTKYANMRRENGHKDPYKVKYWALGNEVWGPWQVEQHSKEDYAKKAFQWGKALKLIDPSIELILCGETGHSSWDHWVLKEASHYISMHSIHIYTTAPRHLPNVTAPLSAERAIEITGGLMDLAMIENQLPHRPSICFDEWNVWDPSRAPGEQGAEERFSLSDALAVAVWLNVFVRQSKYVAMANIAQSVNVISPLLTTREGIRKQSTWWPLLLFSKYMHGHTIGVHLKGGAYDGPTNPRWIRSTMQTPWLDVSAALDDKGTLNLAVVNISDDQDISSNIVSAFPAGVQVFTVNGPDGDMDARPAMNVEVKESKWDGKGAYVFPKHSFTLLRW